MASPVGHTLSGLTVWYLLDRDAEREMTPARLGAITLLANLPDLDLLPGLLFGNPSLWHHGISHSLGIAAAVSVCIMVGAVVLKGSLKTGTWWAAMAGVLLSLHLSLDYLTEDPKPPYGLPFFWPFSADYFIASRPLLWAVRRGPIDIGLVRYSAWVAVKELALFGSVFLSVRWWRTRWGKAKI